MWSVVSYARTTSHTKVWDVVHDAFIQVNNKQYLNRLPPQHFPQQLIQHLIHIHPCHKYHRGLCAPKQCSAHVGSAECTRLLVVSRYQFIYCLNVVADIIYLFMSLISIYSGIMKICSCQRPTIWELWKSVHVNDSQFGKEEGVPNDGSQINCSRKMVEPYWEERSR